MIKKSILSILLLSTLLSCNESPNSKIKHENQAPKLKEELTIIPIKGIDQGGNIYVVFSDKSKKQLTYNKTDHNPILLKDKKQILFVRDENISGMKRRIIMLVNVNDLKETTLTNKKPYYDGLVGTNDILAVDNAELSLDSNYLLFTTEKYATANQLVKVNLKTGKWQEMFSAESFEQINTKTYYGCFFIEQSDLGEYGRDIYYRLVDSNGNIIKKFTNKESMNDFRNGIK